MGGSHISRLLWLYLVFNLLIITRSVGNVPRLVGLMKREFRTNQITATLIDRFIKKYLSVYSFDR